MGKFLISPVRVFFISARWPPLGATILLGAIHTVWHVPLFFVGSMPQTHLSFPMFAVGVIAIAIMDTWLYLRTNANLLLAIVVHLLANYCGGFFSPSSLPLFFGGEGLAALAIVACGGMRAPALHPDSSSAAR